MQVSTLPKGDEAQVKKRDDLQKEVEQIKRALAQQVSLIRANEYMELEKMRQKKVRSNQKFSRMCSICKWNEPNQKVFFTVFFAFCLLISFFCS